MSYLNWMKMEDKEKLGAERRNIKIYDKHRKIIKERLIDEERRLLNEESYWSWFEKKTKEIKEKKLMAEEEERKIKEAEYIEKQNQAIKDFKFNQWLIQKQLEANTKMIEKMIENEKKNEINKLKKAQAEKVWKVWLEKKDKLMKEEKLKKNVEMQEKERERKQKQKLSEQKYKEWLKEASTRPKPVRSNLGLTSLKCNTLTYVNPVPWENILEEENNTFMTSEYDKTLTTLYKKQSNFYETDSNSTNKSYNLVEF
ncbi:uncharacterized protein LOC142333670 [Lycorma delicatula]|uniref:uncharacterized protein LOC142333670 n=1 Tax=Lycorma delicatula TaxID=130591 RepID=UPI003F518288